MGAMDTVATFSTSMIAFRLEGTAKHLMTARDGTFLLTIEPSLMKAICHVLSPGKRDLIMAAGAEPEPFGTAGSKADDDKAAEVFRKSRVQAREIDAESLDE
jgi:hypothetical protein